MIGPDDVPAVDYLSMEDLEAFITRAGFVVKDAGLLESALARPRASAFGEDAYPTLDTKAAALLHSVAQNQALVDGNKRLALLCTQVFCWMNGADLGISESAAFALLEHDLPNGLEDVEEIAHRLRIEPRR